jgi:general secretion pathway protein L
MEYLIIRVEDSQVTAARFRISGRSSSLGGAASFVRDNENSLSTIARQIADGISGIPRVVLCLSPALVAQRNIELPLTDLRKVREVLPAHLQGEMIQSAEDVVFDVLPTSAGRYLAVWAKKTEISQLIDIFKTAGLEPHVVTSDPFSWSLIPGIPSDVVMVDGSAVVVVAEGRVTCVRSLENSDKAAGLTATLSALELSGVALPSRMILFGEHASPLAAVANSALTTEWLELPAEVATQFRTDAVFQNLAGLYAVASCCHAGKVIDFRRGALAWSAGDVKYRKSLSLLVVLASIAVLLLFVSKGLQYRAVRADVLSLNASIFSLYREIFPTRTKAVDELSEVKGEIKKLAGGETSRGALDVFRLLAEAKGTSINRLYEAELEGRTLRIKGDARSTQAVSEFKTALAVVLATVELGEVKSRPDGTVSFSLSGTVKEAAK